MVDFNAKLLNEVINGNLKGVQDAIEKGANVNKRDEYGNTLLHRVASFGDEDIAECLIKNGADVNAQNQSGNTPPHQTPSYGFIEVVKLFIAKGRKFFNLPIEKGVNVNALHQYEATPLHQAASYGRIEVLRLLIKNGANVNAQDIHQKTPLHLAAHYGHTKAVKLLTENGADVNLPDQSGNTPLHLAVKYGHTDAATLLIENGANVNAQYQSGGTLWVQKNGANIHAQYESGHTLLDAAVYSNRKDLAKMLIEKGANFNVRDKYGSTPLHKAAFWGNTDVATLLIEKGANVSAKDHSGNTPLHEAAYLSNPEVVKLLIENGADVNAENRGGNAPLHFAASYRDYDDVAKLLIENGANVSAKDHSGDTPLHHAASWCNTAVVKPLIKNGADVNEQDQSGNTPLYKAAKAPREQLYTGAKDYQVETIEYLLSLKDEEGFSKCDVNLLPTNNKTLLSFFQENSERDQSMRQLLRDAGALEVDEVDELDSDRSGEVAFFNGMTQALSFLIPDVITIIEEIWNAEKKKFDAVNQLTNGLLSTSSLGDLKQDLFYGAVLKNIDKIPFINTLRVPVSSEEDFREFPSKLTSEEFKAEKDAGKISDDTYEAYVASQQDIIFGVHNYGEYLANEHKKRWQSVAWLRGTLKKELADNWQHYQEKHIPTYNNQMDVGILQQKLYAIIDEFFSAKKGLAVKDNPYIFQYAYLKGLSSKQTVHIKEIAHEFAAICKDSYHYHVADTGNEQADNYLATLQSLLNSSNDLDQLKTRDFALDTIAKDASHDSHLAQEIIAAWNELNGTTSDNA